MGSPEELNERMFQILLGENHRAEFLTLIDELHKKGQSKPEIYELFLQFHRDIQEDARTKTNEALYETLCDFMDGFTAWGKGFKILPDEPDV